MTGLAEKVLRCTSQQLCTLIHQKGAAGEFFFPLAFVPLRRRVRRGLSATYKGKKRFFKAPGHFPALSSSRFHLF